MSGPAITAERNTVRTDSRIETARACLVCDVRDARRLFVGGEERFGLGGAFCVVRCAQCSFTWTDIDDGFDLDAWYARGYWREASSSGSGASGVRSVARKFWRAYDGAARPSRWVGSGSVLEVGCGPGYDTRELIERGARVIAIDASGAGLRVAASNGLPVINASAPAFPFAGGVFDTVVMSQSLEHVREPIAALAEARRVLRPGGRLLVMAPNAAGAQRSLFGARWAHWHLPYHLWHFDAGSLRAIAERSGFDVASMRTCSPGDWTLLSARMRLRAVAPMLEHTLVSRAVRAAIAPPLRLIDAAGRGDCLVMEARAPR